MKHKNALLAWGQSWHYPFLSLADGSCIRHGLKAWQAAARNPKRALLAWQRIRMWEARASQERTA